MLYTIIDPLALMHSQPLVPQPLRRVMWDQIELLADSGVVQTVLSTDPAVFLRLNAAFPCGRVRGQDCK